MKIVTILGARPQFIKASSVSRHFLKLPKIIEVILHTGQHFDQNMSQVFFDQMGLQAPKYNLGIQSLSHGAMTGRQLEEIERLKSLENIVMPVNFCYAEVRGLSNEVIQKLTDIRPSTLGQAARISGVTPVAISLLAVFLKRAGITVARSA